MKRDFLTDLGLTDEVADKVMAEHGKEVQELNGLRGRVASAEQERDSLKSQIDERDTQLNDLKGQVGDNKELQDKLDALQSSNEQAKTDAADELANTKKSYEIKLALTQAGARNTKAVQALIDTDKVSLDDKGTVVGLSDQLDKIKEENDYLFSEGPDTGQSTNPGNPNPAGEPTEKDILAEGLGLSEPTK